MTIRMRFFLLEVECCSRNRMIENYTHAKRAQNISFLGCCKRTATYGIVVWFWGEGEKRAPLCQPLHCTTVLLYCTVYCDSTKGAGQLPKLRECKRASQASTYLPYNTVLDARHNFVFWSIHQSREPRQPTILAIRQRIQRSERRICESPQQPTSVFAFQLVFLPALLRTASSRRQSTRQPTSRTCLF